MFIKTGDARIFAVEFGPRDAPAILGIGGWIGSWELWAEPFSILSQRWHTIAYDHRGAGATSAPVESITRARLVEDVFSVLDACGVKQCILAAESAGALTALEAALQHPERITGLVIVDGMYHREASTEKDPFLLGLRRDYENTLDRFVEACLPEPDSSHIKRWGRQIIGRASQEAAIALYLSSGEGDLRPELAHITQPTLILHGEDDHIVPVQDAQQLSRLIPRAKLSILPGAGHVPSITRPQEIAEQILAFFAPGV